MLHVMGLPSGKDIQKPAPFLPANAKWSDAIAVDTTLYAATSGECGGAADGVWAIDLDSAAKPVVSWKTNGGSVVGPVAMSTDGSTLFAAIGPGTVTGDGKANAMVALDAKTLPVKDWFSQPTSEFVTGPMVFRQGTARLSRPRRRTAAWCCSTAASLGGANHATALASRPVVGGGGSVVDSMATWEQATSATATTRWILVPVSGRPSGGRTVNGAVRNGAVMALRVSESGGRMSLEPAWTSHDLSVPAAPVVVNGVVFALGTGASTADMGTPAMLYAYEGASGKALWNSGKAMTSFASPGSFWSALSQVYVGTNDGTLYAFGFLDERR